MVPQGVKGPPLQGPYTGECFQPSLSMNDNSKQQASHAYHTANLNIIGPHNPEGMHDTLKSVPTSRKYIAVWQSN